MKAKENVNQSGVPPSSSFSIQMANVKTVCLILYLLTTVENVRWFNLHAQSLRYLTNLECARSVRLTPSLIRLAECVNKLKGAVCLILLIPKENAKNVGLTNSQMLKAEDATLSNAPNTKF